VTVFDQRPKGSRASVSPNAPSPRRGALAVVFALIVALAMPASGFGQNGGTSPTANGAASFAPLARPEVGIEDENVIFGDSAPIVVANWRSMGVDSVRVQAYWDGVSPDPTSPNVPAGFNPSDPNDPQYNWSDLDRAVNLILANGMRVNLTINQCGPRWASTQPSNPTHCWRPSPRLFSQFVGAVVRRYGSRVDRYLDGSEPNQTAFLAPQFVRKGRKFVPDSPHQYRALVNASYPVIKALDRRSQVIIGEMAPIGSRPSARGGLKPLLFLRELACVDKKLRPVRTGSCKGFRAARGDAFGYHPYVNNRKAPTVPNRDPDIAKIGDIKRLLKTLDTISKKRRIQPTRGRRFPVYFTEYGYISNPPSAKFGVSLSRQALYNAESAFIVWKNRSRIKLLSQYLWMDDPTFGTGLIQRNGRAKPSLAAFPHPFWIDGKLKKALFWGQVRPDASRTVSLQVKPRGSGKYKNVRKFRTDAGGYWHGFGKALRGATYRFQYTLAGGTPAFSIVVPAPRR
jgi:hypothetical protein